MQQNNSVFLCYTDEKVFRMTWEWVKDDRSFIVLKINITMLVNMVHSNLQKPELSLKSSWPEKMLPLQWWQPVSLNELRLNFVHLKGVWFHQQLTLTLTLHKCTQRQWSLQNSKAKNTHMKLTMSRTVEMLLLLPRHLSPNFTYWAPGEQQKNSLNSHVISYNKEGKPEFLIIIIQIII